MSWLFSIIRDLQSIDSTYDFNGSLAKKTACFEIYFINAKIIPRRRFNKQERKQEIEF